MTAPIHADEAQRHELDPVGTAAESRAAVRRTLVAVAVGLAVALASMAALLLWILTLVL